MVNSCQANLIYFAVSAWSGKVRNREPWVETGHWPHFRDQRPAKASQELSRILKAFFATESLAIWWQYIGLAIGCRLGRRFAGNLIQSIGLLSSTFSGGR